ncbi:MAG: PEP-CTERM sorting domain-containing protein [Planctomycetota bacterium]
MRLLTTRLLTTSLAALCLLAAQTASAVSPAGGATSVLLDTDTLAAAASLNLSGATGTVPEVSIPGGVAFGINPRDAATLPTTFTYNVGTLAGVTGTIEHTGSVFFNNDSVEVGNFTIGFDATRATGDNTGFFVASTTGIAAVLFDTTNPVVNEASETLLDLEVDLVVSPEFAGFLLSNSLASTDLTGADVGDARIQAVVPEPATLGLALLAGPVALMKRRRR